jgi:hypothetical protein
MSRLTRREVWSLTFVACALLIAFTLIWLAAPARAQEAPYTPEDTLAAIDQASDEIGVPAAVLYHIVRCETGGRFDPYSVGRQGELGAAQLHPRGLLPTFYAWGYDDPFSPWQSVRFLAQQITYGRASQWSCAR